MDEKNFRVLVAQYWYWKKKYTQHKHPDNKRNMEKFEGLIDKELAADLANLNQSAQNQTKLF